MLLAALLLWAGAALLILKAVAVWQSSAEGPRAGSRFAWVASTPTIVGHGRSVVPFASGTAALALMLTSFVTWERDAGPSSPFWGYVFMVSMLLLVLSYIFFGLTHLFNRPRFLVPPLLRSEQGKAVVWIKKRRGGA
jgi:hypothetical protein